ncbi:MAG TPA: hypothetical protein PK537_00425 [Candidatus Limiplasma sp.]|nr:hypothetical protein [Candidatus Limiplasma sp.]
MNYALIENETVTNIIWLRDENAQDFPTAVKADQLAVQVGDTYADGLFYRNGEVLLPPGKQAEQTIAALDDAVVNLTYENILLEYGI